MHRRKATAETKCSGRRHILRLLALAILRAYAIRMSPLQNWITGQNRRVLPLCRLRPVRRGMSEMRWMVEKENGKIRALLWLFELAWLQLYT